MQKAKQLKTNVSLIKHLLSSLRLGASLHVAFAVCIGFILCVSIYDSLLVVQYKTTILFEERNPVCAMLIKQDPGSLSWFLAGKAVGNFLVVSILIGLYRFNYRHAMPVAEGVAAFQLLLLVYLNFSDPWTGFLYFDGLASHDPEKFSKGITILATHLVVLISIVVGTLTWARYKSNRKRSATSVGSAAM